MDNTPSATDRVTIRDVARVAGVSTKTVSRVTNGDDYVAADTARRVHAAIAELGYRANPFARSLRTGSDQAVAIIVESLADPFFSAMVDAVEHVVREAGLFLIVASSGRTPAEERAVLSGVLTRSVQGLIVVPNHLSYGPNTLPTGPTSVPVVFVDRPPDDVNADVVIIDNVETARHCAEHLIAHGHRRIAFVGSQMDRYTVSSRLDGYRAALAANDIPHDPQLVLECRPDVSVEQLLAARCMAGAQPVTAILCANAVASLRVVSELHRLKRTDIAVVSFDDFPMADSLDPAITVALQDPRLMGQRAFQLLRERIDGTRRQPRKVVLATTFIERGSGEILPTNKGQDT